MFAGLERGLRQRADRTVHGVVGLAFARQQRVFEQPMHRFRQARFVAAQFQRLGACCSQGVQAHTVFGERAGLVHAEYGGSAQGLDHGRTPHQHLDLGHAPGAERQKHRQRHRKLFRQHGHGQCDAGEQALHPVATDQAIAQHHSDAHQQRHQPEPAHQASDGALQQGLLGADGRQ